MPRFVNLLFQGGGVKGLSYAGALSQMPADLQVRVVGGTSAGAIAAALIASGHEPRDLRKTLESLDLSSLLPKDALATLTEIRGLVDEVLALARKAPVSGLPLWKGAAVLLWNRKALKKHFAKLSRDYGIFSSATLEAWVKQQTGGIRFEDVDIEDLRIVAADVSTGEYKVYSKGETGKEFVHVAATASASIPFFFEPKQDGGFLVDGGMLSNFPPVPVRARSLSHGRVPPQLFCAAAQPDPEPRRLHRAVAQFDVGCPRQAPHPARAFP